MSGSAGEPSGPDTLSSARPLAPSLACTGQLERFAEEDDKRNAQAVWID